MRPRIIIALGSAVLLLAVAITFVTSHDENVIRPTAGNTQHSNIMDTHDISNEAANTPVIAAETDLLEDTEEMIATVPRGFGLILIKTRNTLVVFNNGKRVDTQRIPDMVEVYLETGNISSRDMPLDDSNRVPLNVGDSLIVRNSCVVVGRNDTELNVNVPQYAHCIVTYYSTAGDSWTTSVQGFMGAKYIPYTSKIMVYTETVPAGNICATILVFNYRGKLMARRTFARNYNCWYFPPNGSNKIVLTGLSELRVVNHDLSDYWQLEGNYSGIPAFSESGRYVGVAGQGAKLQILNIATRKATDLGICGFIKAVHDNGTAIVQNIGEQNDDPWPIKEVRFRL